LLLFIGKKHDQSDANKLKYLLLRLSGFVQILESPEIKMLRFPGLESPGKRHRSWKTVEKPWNSKVVVLEILLSSSTIAH